MRLGKRDIIEELRTAGMRYSPLAIASIDTESGRRHDTSSDAVIEFRIEHGPSFRASAQLIPAATPKAVCERSEQIRDDLPKGPCSVPVPLIIAPYVPAKQADVLAWAGLSWLDLSGNMVIRVGNRIYIERTGRPNRFPDTAPIRKIFQGTASLVGRALLLEPKGFASLSHIVEFIQRRGGAITLPTVSKVLKSLEEELLVVKSRRSISASEPGQLLDRLAEGYADSRGRSGMIAHRYAVEDRETMLARLCSKLGSIYVFCGFYAAQLKGLAAGGAISMYVNDMNRFREAVKSFAPAVYPDEEFGNLSVIATKSRLPWFNVETRDEGRIVDDLQLYLEMMIDTPRGPKIAKSLRQRILPEDRDG
jgi:hypothetical protein